MAEIVAGALLSSMFEFLFARMESPEIVVFFKGHKLDYGLVKKLKIAMITVSGLLDHAEEKQIVVPAVKKWLDELKDAAYEADDLLDEIAYEALRIKLETGSAKQKVLNLVSSRITSFEKEVTEKLEKILELLEYLLKQMKALGLTLREGIGEKPTSSHKTTNALPDGDESGICGRVDEKEGIIESLLSDGTGVIGVICIVGIGGVSKTTLAQLVYNDNKVKEKFDVKAWVYISQEFVMFNIMINILEVVTSGTCGNVDPKMLQSELEQKLMGKKFLIVLDDVWNDKNEDWYNLLKPLNVGAQGSKIVITTRNESVASAIFTTCNASVASATRALKYDLRELAYNDCWNLFAKHAFDDGKASDHFKLEVIGREIVKKCNGLPLAAKAIGSLLRFKSYEEWEKILKSQMWNLVSDNILPALKLSYYQLPSHLKRCFAYCAMFPKGYEFSKEFLVSLWMAEGFLVQSENDNDMENIGNEYFNGLVSRSFLQMSSSPQPCFIMHDHMHDLAKSISGEFYFMYEDKDSSVASTKTRHLYVRASNPYQSTRLIGCQSLHTFISEYTDKKNVELHTLLPKLKYLRVLSLNYYYGFKLLDPISNMKHLRYLKLQSSRIKRLPESVGSLYNLQILILRDCWRLVELPTNMRRLINLRCLDVRGTNLKKMPVKMGKLMKLQTLTNFILGKWSGSGIVELGKLHHIQGELSIENLQNVVGPKHASAANLKAKKKLKKLKFTWAGRSKASSHARSTLESLIPHEKVESLSIVGYNGTEFPSWLGSSESSLSNLVSLELDECSNCSSLPPLGQLASLKDLSIRGLDELVAVDSEFYGSCSPAMKPFGSLITLRFERMGKWCKWKDEDEAFPLLQELYLIRCPKLTTPIPSQLPCLTKLQVVEYTKQLVDSLRLAPTIVEMLLMEEDNYFFDGVKLDKLPSGLHRLEIRKFVSAVSLFDGIKKVDGVSSILEEIEIQEYDALEWCFPLEFFPKLKKLYISKCLDFKSFSASEDAIGGQLTYLNSLELRSCPKLVCFPKGGLPAPNLKHLSLNHCSNLKALPECMHSLLPSLVKLEINDCPQLESFPKGGLPSDIKSLIIKGCIKLKIKHIACCNNCGDNESFSEETLLLPCVLTCLEVRNLQNLESLDYKGFIELRELVIEDCLVFKCMPESMQAFLCCLVKLKILECPELLELFLKQGLPTSLESVEICNCKKVIGGLMECDLRMLQSLECLIIGGNDDVESLPEETLLPSSLTCLKIRNFHNLKYLDLQHLTSLTELRIWYCPVLQCLPKKGLPPSVADLSISGCPLLTRRCKRKGGEDWHKISRIPFLIIDCDVQ